MTDRDDLVTIRGLIVDALPALAIQSDRGIYPYAVTNGEPLRLGVASMSTNSMICYTIAALEGLLPQAVVAVSREQSGIDAYPGRELHDCLARGLGAMTKYINDPAAADSLFFRKRTPDAGPFDSGTFGRQDPFTLTWLVELLRLALREPGLADSAETATALTLAEEVARTRCTAALVDPDNPVLTTSRSGERAVLHPLPLLRIVQLAKLLEMNDEQQLARASRWFTELLHMQLSLRSIEHAAFDPAKLVFALEGMLETSPLRVTRPIMRSFSSCIETTRQVDPTLRAVTPFKATESGAVHLFAGVEVFSSLLRIARMREQTGDVAFFEQIKPALHAYLQWLQATVVIGRVTMPPAMEQDSYPSSTPADYLGWESEFAHTGDLSIHLWLTSQVILLLHGYDALLTRSVASAELARVGLIIDVTDKLVPETADQRLARARKDDPLQVGDASPYRTVSRLAESFVNPRATGDFTVMSYSCLLYGPPGTGKTTLARRVAQELGWPLLTVTTGDFIVDGEAQVEARAKDIFMALLSQRNSVVFFDEIDRLILDRDTRDYKSQGDMLQFMTPSMLTKLNNLRRSEQVVIMIATNYADRIDHAIKRPGRIDQKLLVLPPDMTRRQILIKNCLGQRGDARSADNDLIRDAARQSAWLTVTEVATTTRNAARTGADLVAAMQAVVPAISLDTYLARLEPGEYDDGRDPAPELLEEAFLLVYLLMEGKESERLPSRYEKLGNWWSASGASIVRDAAVKDELDRIFG